MSRGNPSLEPLATRKQLLLTASEINRVHLSSECGALGEEIRTLVGTFHSSLSAASAVLDGFQTLRRSWSHRTESRSSWLGKALRMFQSGAAVWRWFRSSSS